MAFQFLDQLLSGLIVVFVLKMLKVCSVPSLHLALRSRGLLFLHIDITAHSRPSNESGLLRDNSFPSRTLHHIRQGIIVYLPNAFPV